MSTTESTKWTSSEVRTAWELSGMRFEEFLVGMLPLDDWHWYDLYLKQLYLICEVSDQYAHTMSPRLEALALVINWKEKERDKAKAM